VVVSKSVPDEMTDGAQVDAKSKPARARWLVVLGVLVAVGWIWPHDPIAVPDRISDAAWMLGWSTVLVLIGAISGYVLKTRWSILFVPFALYVGGVVHWFQYEWGFQQPHWPEFLAVSAIAFGVLLVIAGIPAGIACRVVAAESRPFGRGSDSVRLSAAIASLLALLSITALVVFPFPYLGGLFGFAAALAGVGVLQEGQPTPLERLLAISGIALGSVVVIIQLYALWSLVHSLI
jgi:hypothetical protein